MYNNYNTGYYAPIDSNAVQQDTLSTQIYDNLKTILNTTNELLDEHKKTYTTLVEKNDELMKTVTILMNPKKETQTENETYIILRKGASMRSEYSPKANYPIKLLQDIKMPVPSNLNFKINNIIFTTETTNVLNTMKILVPQGTKYCDTESGNNLGNVTVVDEYFYYDVITSKINMSSGVKIYLNGNELMTTKLMENLDLV